jgi:hypothetical protein
VTTGTAARGLLRNVVGRIAEGSTTRLLLDCGHEQDRPHVHVLDVPKRVICFECGEQSR